MFPSVGAQMGHPWALMGRALTGPPGPSWAGPLWAPLALMGRTLMGPLGPYGLGPYGSLGPYGLAPYGPPCVWVVLASEPGIPKAGSSAENLRRAGSNSVGALGLIDMSRLAIPELIPLTLFSKSSMICLTFILWNSKTIK